MCQWHVRFFYIKFTIIDFLFRRGSFLFLEEISDDYLVCLYFDKNQDAIDELYDRYTRYIYGIIVDAQRIYGNYLDFDDLFQDCFLAFLGCIERYENDKGNFYFYVRRAMERKIKDKIDIIMKMNDCVSLDELKYEDGNKLYIDCVCECEDVYDCGDSLKDVLFACLKEEEREIIELKLKGYSYQDICEIINKSKQYIYRKVNKIKNILKDIIEKID